MGKTLAIIHTTPVTVGSLKQLANEYLPGFDVINFVDDSILPQLAKNEGKIEEVQERLIQYAKYAEQVGAHTILNACSSVGEVVEKAREQLNIPIIRIDEPMAETAVDQGGKIGVVATLATTLNPTIKLLKATAEKYGKQVDIQAELAGEAYECLISGDRDGHDDVLVEVLLKLADETDVVVLAQASMARVIEKLPKQIQAKFLTSPRLGMEQVKRTMEGL
ncbi:aspartate/glutamate racemase family protein [Lederbergia citrea]|uniref:aspartate/glutamate racemase family protein n=1 Tax=Lederbergia citrea TaxID=2833581 RepID=UPI001BC9D494|nr:aspartate/glutamate racemase family protein [Lederbergia citrea]MBS4205197.1 aspartate/glutamate racemase family protein [Lederbergia citrea]